MGKKKRNQPDLEEILQRPWCYYCERDFDDLKVLLNHQKAKHFKCERCGRRLNTAGGLSVHMTQVHKESLTTIENALPNRAGLEVEIFGMEGIPEDVVIAHRQRVATQFVQAGNQPINHNVNPATAGGNSAKKPKLEAGSDLKKRLAEHRAKKAAEEAATVNVASPIVETPVGPPQSYPPQPVFTPPQYAPGFAGPPGPPGPPVPAGPMGMGGPGFNGYAPAYGQAPAPFQPPPFASPPVPFGQQPFEPPPFQAPQNAYAPPSQYQTGPPNIPARPFGTNLPDMPHQVSPAPPPSMLQAPRPNSLPPAPGLPQRPSFGAPAVNAFQLQQMHQGHIPNSSLPYTEQPKPSNGTPVPTSNTVSATVAQQSQQSMPLQTSTETIKEEVKPSESSVEKKSKKDKDKDIKLVYSDNEVSPEEKLSKLARYAFHPVREEATAASA